MLIPNIILLCGIIYNLGISQSAKKAKLLKINVPINMIFEGKKVNTNIFCLPNFSKYKIGHLMILCGHVTLSLQKPIRHAVSAECLLATSVPPRAGEQGACSSRAWSEVAQHKEHTHQTWENTSRPFPTKKELGSDRP